MNNTGIGRVLMKPGTDGTAMEEMSRMITSGESSNKTLFTVVKKKELLDKAIDIVKSLCGDFCGPGKGILFAIPLAHVDGLPGENWKWCIPRCSIRDINHFAKIGLIP